jgi:hypothetical protein
MAEGFCVKCGTEVETFDGLECCPRCKTHSIPCSYSDQVKIDINIHELRTLCIWAERWVNVMQNEQTQADCAETLRSIVNRLQKQVPSEVALLLCDEMKAARAEGLKIESNAIDI